MHPGCSAVQDCAALLVKAVTVDARVRQQQLKQRPRALNGGIRSVVRGLQARSGNGHYKACRAGLCHLDVPCANEHGGTLNSTRHAKKHLNDGNIQLVVWNVDPGIPQQPAGQRGVCIGSRKPQCVAALGISAASAGPMAQGRVSQANHEGERTPKAPPKHTRSPEG